jgi:hypothetical protein
VLDGGLLDGASVNAPDLGQLDKAQRAINEMKTSISYEYSRLFSSGSSLDFSHCFGKVKESNTLAPDCVHDRGFGY